MNTVNAGSGIMTMKDFKTSSAISTTTPQQHSLLTLPQELLDIIFDYAHPEQAIAKRISREDWDARERSKRRENNDYVMGTYPGPRVNDCEAFLHLSG